MEKDVTYEQRCRKCLGSEIYIMRSANANSNLTDHDCRRIAHLYAEDRKRIVWCDRCKQETVQEVVAFNLPI